MLPLPDPAALVGRAVPHLRLPATSGGSVDLAGVGRPRAVVYLYPMTGRPGIPMPRGWDEIPGARGCTPESCGFRDHHAEIAARGAEVYGLSAQTTDDQREAAERLNLPFPLLSDHELRLAAELPLPTFRADGRVLYGRITLVLREGRVEHVFHPVSEPARHAEEVLAWLAGRAVDG
ncbi:MAG TPA: peroxiredoxin [Candidatus Limnocylindria bacterium]|nr:peroxiredoxin [Candidatus Limnocylindria bacterium]